jgi:valyl-tRNA synthetase
MELPNAYNAKEVEKKWQDFWEKSKIYKFDPDSKKKIFSIDTPPPYASAGHLHIGHALHYTQFEIIAMSISHRALTITGFLQKGMSRASSTYQKTRQPKQSSGSYA